jgi:hypothetical protein
VRSLLRTSLRTGLLVALLLQATGCWLGGPDRLSELHSLRIQASLFDGNYLSVQLHYDRSASGGCAELRSGFGGTLDGVPDVDTFSGARSGFDGCNIPTVGFTAGPAAQYQLRVFDSSRTVEMDITNPWQSDAQVVRCVGASRCDFIGPLASSSL